MKKLSSVILSLLMIFGICANDISFVNAMNTKSVHITTEKEEIKINEKTNLKADVILPEDAEIVSYSWNSDNESVAIISGENNVATVTGLGAGKAKITVTVNYNTKIAVVNEKNSEEVTEQSVSSNISDEIEISVTETKAETVSVSKPNTQSITAKKETSVENSEDVLDPVTAEYIKKNINTEYANANMMRLDQVLVVKNTLVDGNGINENETIDSFFLRDNTEELFITTIPATVALYNTDVNSKYYVGVANTMMNDKTAEVKDWIFAINNNNGEVITDGVYFDKNTGLAYVSKDLFGDVAGNVQVQFLQAVTQSVKKLSSRVSYSLIDDNDTVKAGDGTVRGFSFKTSVKTEKGLKKSELMVSVNGLPVSDFDYDDKTGIVTVEQSSTAVQSINVTVNEESVIKKVADKFFNVVDVNAISMSQMGCAGTVDVPSDIGIGSYRQVSLYKGYASSWGSPTLPTYGISSERNLMNLIWNGGSLDYSKLNYQNTQMYLGVWLQGGIDGVTGIYHPSFWNWSPAGISGAAQMDSWLRLQCTHLSNPDSGKGVEWKDENINIRVLDMSADEIVVGFLTKRVNSQSGAGIAKFKKKPKQGNLSIKKVNGNPSLTEGNDCYSLAGAEYQLKDGNGNVVATLTTDVNGNAYAGNIVAGNYTLVETKASAGFELNSEHTSVTINAGQTTSLNGIGCLVEQPVNDPLAIQITKADMDSAESSPQGNASLEGAEFTVKYYNALYDKVSDLPEKAARTWVLATQKDSRGGYRAMLTEKYKVSGDDFYVDTDGTVVLPLGTITIQETKAPDGYLLEGATLIDKDGNTSNVEHGVFISKITQNGNIASLVAGNFPIVKDEVKKQHIEIEKIALDHNGKSTPLNGAEFTIKLKSDVDANGWDKAKTYDVITTKTIDGEAGQGVSKDLPYGEYILRETKTPAGYVQADDTIFVIEADSSETIVVQHIMVTDKENHIRLYKYDIETEAPLRQAEYLIFNETTNKEVGRYKTNDDGIIDLYKLEGGNSYYAQEITAPNGYKINDTKFYFDIDDNGFVHVSDKNSNENKDVFTIKDKGDMEISLSNKLTWFKLNINKVNDVKKKLAGAEFTLYKDNDCTQEVKKGITDENGNLKFNDVEVGAYYLKETKAPAGYRKLLDPIKVEFKCVNKEHTFFVNDMPIKANTGDYTMTVENDWYVGNMTILNQRGSKLPATGSNATLLIIGAGIGLCLYGIKKYKKGEE